MAKPIIQVPSCLRKKRCRVLHLSDVQLEEVLPGAPWADGTVGGVLAANADHGRMHWKWVKDARLQRH